jgi:hypothetical protein
MRGSGGDSNRQSICWSFGNEICAYVATCAWAVLNHDSA